MQPMNNLLDKTMTLLAADVPTLAPATGNKVHLSQQTFTPSPARVIGDFLEATFTGYAALVAGTGAQQTFTDAATGLRTIQILEPAGGWHWVSTGTANLPQTIYGYYVTDNGTTTLFGCALLQSPVTITASNQSVDVGNIRLSLVLSPWS